MTLPIFDQNQAQIAKAYYLYQQDLKAYEEMYLNIAQDIRMAADRTETAAGNVVFYRDELVPQVERNLTFARDSYNAGQTSILALLEAQKLLLEAKQNYIEVKLEAASSVADMEEAVGISTDRILESASPERELDDSKTMN
jgi:cobalt-zinc-cadmium efflux system outer membrane protein